MFIRKINHDPENCGNEIDILFFKISMIILSIIGRAFISHCPEWSLQLSAYGGNSGLKSS